MSDPIHYLSATELARQIAVGQLSAREVVEAHIERIEKVDADLHALAVPTFDRARHDADRADKDREKKKPLGPLHGVPVTIKDCYHVADTPATIGLSAWKDRIDAYDSVLVKRLRQAGAIVLGKTNVPQLMIFHETDNPVYGRTNNPWNLDRGPGGSSGGEAAIVAAGGSPLGLGSDLGGSIRVPAHFCGVCGLKPTDRRLTLDGLISTLRGMEAVLVQPGPIARSVQDLKLGFQALSAGPRRRDESAVPTDAADEVDPRQLRVGFFDDDAFFEASPALRRAVREGAEALAGQGVEVVPFHPPNVREAMAIYFGLLSADGAADLRRLLRGSTVDRRVRQLCRIGKMPRLLRPLVAHWQTLLGQHRLAELLTMTGPCSAGDYWQLVRRREAYLSLFIEAMEEARCDALLCPPHALPAIKHGRAADLVLAASPSILFNLLGMPSGVVPVTQVAAGEMNSRNPGRDSVERLAASTDRESVGLPVGVQIVARHWREDVVLSLMSLIESAVCWGEGNPAPLGL